jgi:lactate dehydrogenase-like 2-hydroxyacid dehydrogenase
MKPEVLVLTRIYAPTLAALEQAYTVHTPWSAPDPQAALRELGRNVRAVVTTSLAGLSGQQLAVLPRLEVVACMGIGHRAIDLTAARERGVVVTITPTPIDHAVADLGVGLMIAVMRRICETDRFVRAGRWTHRLPPLGADLAGKVCGIVGLGAIGSAIASRARAFGMAVCYHGPREKSGVPYRYYADIEALAAAADCLVVTCAATDATRNLVDVRVLEALGSRGFLVNVARGAIVDETALVSALANGRIAGAGLDVYWDEPHVPQGLLDLDNVVLVPHIGSSTIEIREQRGAHVLASLEAHFAGRAVPNRVA